ncbi:hypothetical protein EUTSA_v10015501mg [Eutrema salsugineum]|uniref:Piwi domain-containing protein n=1 Tax=Eutrema salsugineum TaxID=72664 RepID=V4N8T6_EUTSA|nr:hypothetical protein EUTSA_v10015501mg [Eutrema salsugineum]
MDSSKSALLPIARRGNGSKGQKIQLRTNHFRVAITYEDGNPVVAKGIGRKILENVQDTYKSDLGSKYFAYDGDKTLFTVGPLPANKLDFSVVLEDMSCSRGNTRSDDADRKRLRRPNKSKKFNVAITFAKQISIQAIDGALQGIETNHLQDAIRVLDVILRQNAARQGCLLVRQSFFHNDAKFFSKEHGGFYLCRGFHSSFRTTQGGLSLNMDVSSTLIVKPGPVVDFLTANQGKNRFSIDWKEAERTLKNLRVKVITTNQEYKITGLSRLPCKDQTFIWKQKKGNGEVEEEIKVFDYYKKNHDIRLHDSGDLRCINVGKPKRPTYFPMELCHLVSLQRYTKALTIFQRSNLVRESIQKPLDKRNMLNRALENCNYNDDTLLQECGVRIGSEFTQVEGHILPTPNLKVGNGKDIIPSNGRWNFNNKEFVKPVKVTGWAVVNFSVQCDPHRIVRDLIRCGKMKGMDVVLPLDVFEEGHRFKAAPGSVRVEKMFEVMKLKFRDQDWGKPEFLLCILSKNSNVYGPWKKRTLIEDGIKNQCIAPPNIVKDQYLTNVLLKINAKLGGLNSELAIERSLGIPAVMRVPTIIIGMDVSHGSPGQSDVPSISAVVSSREWPLISKYKACVRTQSPKVEMIDNLFNRVSDKVDDGIMRELLDDFKSCSGMKPDHIIVFRDGLSESQFNQVLNIELGQMKQACKFLEENWYPKFTVIIAQKKHHTRFFQERRPADNVPPGTIIDSKICHPRNNDFYLCAHAGMLGTTRPTHYHVLYDEIGFSTDDLQELVHSLSYVYQRSTTAISVDFAAFFHDKGTAMKFEDMSETSSSHGGITTSGAAPVPPMPKLNKAVATSMFFC